VSKEVKEAKEARRKFTKEFKQEACRLVVDQGQKRSETARNPIAEREPAGDLPPEKRIKGKREVQVRNSSLEVNEAPRVRA
jgi:hypothetical protein